MCSRTLWRNVHLHTWKMRAWNMTLNFSAFTHHSCRRPQEDLFCSLGFIAFTDSLCVRERDCWRKENPGHVLWGDRARLISNALYERKLSPLSDLLLSLPPSSLFSPFCIHLVLFPLLLAPLQLTPLYFIWLSASFLWLYQDFTLNWFSSRSIHDRGIHEENKKNKKGFSPYSSNYL